MSTVTDPDGTTIYYPVLPHDLTATPPDLVDRDVLAVGRTNAEAPSVCRATRGCYRSTSSPGTQWRPLVTADARITGRRARQGGGHEQVYGKSRDQCRSCVEFWRWRRQQRYRGGRERER